jgi:hypothetical protein
MRSYCSRGGRQKSRSRRLFGSACVGLSKMHDLGRRQRLGACCRAANNWQALVEWPLVLVSNRPSHTSQRTRLSCRNGRNPRNPRIQCSRSNSRTACSCRSFCSSCSPLGCRAPPERLRFTRSDRPMPGSRWRHGSIVRVSSATPVVRKPAQDVGAVFRTDFAPTAPNRCNPLIYWRSLPDSNRCYSLERAVS